MLRPGEKMISALFAVDENGGIGNNNTLPWPYNRDDLQWFKSITVNQIVVMGRKTWDSEGMPKPLPNRQNVIVTTRAIDRDDILQFNGDMRTVLSQLEELVKEDGRTIFVIGGADIIWQSLPKIEKVFLTRIPGTYECDTRIDIDNFLQSFSLTTIRDIGTCKGEEYETI